MTGAQLTLPELEHALRNASREIDRAIAPVVQATAMAVAETQRANVPVASGRTRDSIAATAPDGGAFGPSTVDAEIGPSWWIGRLIETGTVTMAPRVFVGNSYEPHRAAHEQAMLDAAAKVI